MSCLAENSDRRESRRVEEDVRKKVRLGWSIVRKPNTVKSKSISGGALRVDNAPRQLTYHESRGSRGIADIDQPAGAWRPHAHAFGDRSNRGA